MKLKKIIKRIKLDTVPIPLAIYACTNIYHKRKSNLNFMLIQSNGLN